MTYRLETSIPNTLVLPINPSKIQKIADGHVFALMRLFVHHGLMFQMDEEADMVTFVFEKEEGLTAARLLM